MGELLFFDEMVNNRRTIRRWVNVDLGDDNWGIISEDAVQIAIPWCTTHDASMGAESPICDYGDLSGHGGCVISTGGLVHKWWKDT